MPATQILYVARTVGKVPGNFARLDLIMAESDPDAIKQAKEICDIRIEGEAVKSSYELYRVATLGLVFEGHRDPTSDE